MIKKKNENYELAKSVALICYIFNSVLGISIRHSLTYFNFDNENFESCYLYVHKLLKTPTNEVKSNLSMILEKLPSIYELILNDNFFKLLNKYREVETEINMCMVVYFKEKYPLKNTFISKDGDDAFQLQLNKSYNAKRNQELGQFFRKKEIAEIFEYKYLSNVNEHSKNELKKCLYRIDDFVINIFNDVILPEIKKIINTSLLDENLKKNQILMMQRLEEDLKPLKKSKVIKI